MTNKTLANLLTISIILAMLTGIFEPSMSIGISDNLFEISGLGILIFGIWSIIRLRKSE